MEKVALSASLSSGEANFIYAVSQRAERRMERRVERRRKRGSRVEIASFSHSAGEEGGREVRLHGGALSHLCGNATGAFQSLGSGQKVDLASETCARRFFAPDRFFSPLSSFQVI